MSWINNLLLLATFCASAVPMEEGVAEGQRHPDAVEVFHCDFNRRHDVDQLWDVNYDGWPDKWTRVYGKGFPHYVDTRIEEDSTAVSGRCLTVHLNGGGAHIQSPAIGVSSKFSYKIETRLRMAGVRHSRVQLRVEFCDERRNVMQVASSDWYTSTKDWEQVHIGPINPDSEDAVLARLTLVVESGSRPDLEGTVSVDDVWMARLPKMVVTTNSPFNVYENPHDVLVTCELSGILDKNPDILFELLDASSLQLDNNSVRLEGRLITERLSRASDIVNDARSKRAGYAGSTSWSPPITRHGFYRVRVTMKTSAGMLKRDVISIAVVPPLGTRTLGEFGWSLAGDEIPLSFDHLGDLLPRVAVTWIKLPVWYDPDDVSAGDNLIAFAEQLAAKDVEVVGVVDEPPEGSELASRLQRGAAIADTLSADDSSWLPSIDPVLTRLSLRIRWWQLGDDHDTSFLSFPAIEREIAELRRKLFRFGQDVSLGIGWQWNQAPSGTHKPSWDFQQFSASPPLTGKEMASYLQLPQREGVRRWVLIEPLSRRDYDLATRARDLVEQILAAKIHRADAIFAAQPFDNDCGLMDDNGAPADLLLPWRTTASLLSGARYIGSLQLPRNSTNRLFETVDGDVVMVVWGAHRTREVLHLGTEVEVVDVWGRAETPEMVGHRQVINVDTLPVFVRGMDAQIAKWRMSTRFDTPHVPSVFGRSHSNALQFKNTFAQGVGGSFSVVPPEGWQIAPHQQDFKLGAGAKTANGFEITLPFDANSGKVPVRIDFQVTGDRPHQFSIYRELNVGDGEVQIDIHTRLEQNGDLVVEQTMVNRGREPVDFKCLLYARDQRRQRIQVFRLGANPDVKTYRYPNGAQLIGSEMWLRAEEVDGQRVLNHRFVVEY
jgi:hypothetical protein